MKVLKTTMVLLCILCLVGIGHAYWNGQVRKNGNPLTPGGFATVTACGWSNPHTTANAQGWYTLDATSGMKPDSTYTHCWAEWWYGEEEWGGWCSGGTYQHSPPVTGKHIAITHPPTEWPAD